MRNSTYGARTGRDRRTSVRCAGGRYRADGASEARYEPGSNRRVLKNLLGIRSVREMDRVEQHRLLQVTDWAVDAFPNNHRFSCEDLRLLHRKWLGDIYPWAGEYRQVNVSKGGFMFAAAAQVPRLMAEFEAEHLVKPCDDKLLALAQAHTELLLIHPFREGNGRLSRLFATLMALQAGLPEPTFELLVRRHRAQYFAAVRAGLDRNYEPMRRLFALVINDGEG